MEQTFNKESLFQGMKISNEHLLVSDVPLAKANPLITQGSGFKYRYANPIMEEEYDRNLSLDYENLILKR